MVPGFGLCVGSWEPGNLTMGSMSLLWPTWTPICPWLLSIPLTSSPTCSLNPDFLSTLTLTWTTVGPYRDPQSFYNCWKAWVLLHLYLESCRSKLLQEKDRCNSDMRAVTLASSQQYPSSSNSDWTILQPPKLPYSQQSAYCQTPNRP